MISTGFFRASPGALVLDAMVLACVSDPRGARLALVCAAEPGDPGAGQHVAIHDPARGTCVLLRATADGRLFAAWAGDLVAVLHAPPGEEPSTLALYDPTDATLVREVSLGARASDTFGHWDSKGAAALEAATDAPIVVAWEADWLSRARYARAYSVPELRLQGEAFLEADDTWEEPYCWRPVERLPAAVSADGTRFAEVSISAPHRRYALRVHRPWVDSPDRDGNDPEWSRFVPCEPDEVFMGGALRWVSPQRIVAHFWIDSPHAGAGVDRLVRFDLPEKGDWIVTPLGACLGPLAWLRGAALDPSGARAVAECLRMPGDRRSLVVLDLERDTILYERASEGVGGRYGEALCWVDDDAVAFVGGEQDAPTLVRWDLREDVRRATALPLGEDPEGWNCKVFGTLGPDVILAAHGWSSGHERLVLTSVPLAPTPTDHAPEPTPVTRS